jgi:hypothetical protein
MKHVVVVNGKPRSGKDTFINYCRIYADNTDCVERVESISSISPVMDALKSLGWDGEKRDDIRNLLSQLKFFWICNNDGPTAYLIKRILDVKEDNCAIFVQIREPAEIDKLRNAMIALKPLGIDVTTVLIMRPGTDREYSNTSDNYVFDYEYEHTINNDGTQDQLYSMMIPFMNILLGGN